MRNSAIFVLRCFIFATFLSTSRRKNSLEPVEQPATVTFSSFTQFYNSRLITLFFLSYKTCLFAGSHRKFRKLCMYIQNHLNATTDRNDGNFDNNRNGMLPDGLLQPNQNESLRENGKESGKETGRKTSLSGRSTENLLDSDESIDC